MANKKYENPTSRLVYASKDDFDFLKNKGIGVSNFFRQAVKAFKENKWKYDYMK